MKIMRAYIIDEESLRLAIAEAGHNQVTLAEAIGTSKQYLNQIINQDKIASPVMAKKITDAIGKNREEFFYIKNGSYSEQEQAAAN